MSALLSGQNTIIMVPLEKDTTFLSAWITVGNVLEYFIDTSITPIPIRKPAGWQNGLRINKDYRSIMQSFYFHVDELTGSGSMDRTVTGNGFLQFGIFQMTPDTLGVERPFNFVSMMSFGCLGQSTSMSTTLALYHLSQGTGPYGRDGGTSNLDLDIVADTPFTAAANGLMTSIQFGWLRYADPGGITTMSGSVEFKGLKLLVAASS